MEQTHHWQDVTLELTTIRKQLKMMEMIKDDELTLQDCMQAQQINDDKMDPKFDISHHHTIHHKLQNKLVKLPTELTLKQTASVLANVLQLQACVLQGQPLSSTIYSFAYLYDRKIWQDSYLFTAVVESINCLGSYFYELIKQAATVKEDDVTIPGFSFSRLNKTHDEVMELILQAQKKFEAQNKKNEDKLSANLVLNILRLRRSLHGLAKNLSVSFDPKNQKKIETDIQATKKRLVALQELKYAGQKQLLPGVFLNDLHKTIKVHFGPRQLRLVSFQDSLKQIRNALEQLQLFIPTPTKVSQIKNRAQILESKPYNSWSKSYIKYNVFAKQNYIFSLVKTEDALVEDINDWVHLNQNTKSHQKFINLVKIGATVINETIYRLLANSMRWHWQCSKIYEDYNVLIHMANEVDSYVVTNPQKQMYVSSWFYYYGLELMIKQIMVGFENNLFELNELKYVFFLVESLLSVQQRNGQIHLRKLDKTIIPNFNQGNFTKKMKKKLGDNEKCMFSNIIFKKGLYLYFRALFKLMCILHSRKLIPNKFEDTEEIRIKNRFRIFKHVLFTRTIDYADYKKTVEQVCKKQNQYLQQSLEQLKEVKNIYKLFTSQLEDSETYFRQREDAQLLTKMSVKASLVVMTVKMGVQGKKIGVVLGGRYPEFTIE